MLLACCFLPLQLLAGGSGLNTVVIINENSSNSCALGNYYCERRQIPPENVVRISWTGGNTSWTLNDFQTRLMSPLLTALAERQLNNQIRLVVLSMDIPFQTVSDGVVNSTTSVLFYGFKDNSGTSSKAVANSYAFSEAPLENARSTTSVGHSFLATMITGRTLAEARKLVDQGVNSDGTFPTQPVVLAKSSDSLRNIRFTAFDNVLFNTAVRGNYSMLRTNSDAPSSFSNLLGFETGMAGFSVRPGTFVPGAIADSLTSYGGIIFGPNGQTSLLEFLQAGAAGSYGTVTEPSPDPEKFPDPQVYFFQSRGFSLAECYYQSIAAPFLGLIVGEPLAAPFAVPAHGRWLNATTNALSAVAPLALSFSSDLNHPLQQVDLFVDGKFFETLTTIQPAPGNQVALSLNGSSIIHTVIAGETPETIAQNLAATINAPATLKANQIGASVHGDRLELRYLATSSPARPVPPGKIHVAKNPSNDPETNPATATAPNITLTTSSIGSAASLTTFLTASRNHFVNSPAQGWRKFSIGGPVQNGSWLRLSAIKTNGVAVVVGVTNDSASATAFELSRKLVDAINALPSLESIGGAAAESLVAGWSGAGTFYLRARDPGMAAARFQVLLAGSSNLVINPANVGTLTDNLSDLQPRNHVYVSAGATNLNVNFSFDTTSWPDGFHVLTAVAYEGSHVRTQTRVTLPVLIQNTVLNATLSLPGAADSISVRDSFNVQVNANRGDVTSIALFTTGGLWETITNRASGIFTVNGSELGEGLHPFYALVTTASGLRYRTETQWMRILP